MIEWVVTCLALNVYHEARGEPMEGKVAVALTTINRARAANCEICDAVFQPSQFSWTIGWDRKHPPKGPEWEDAKMVALASLYMKDYTGGAIYYHEKGVSPAWARTKELIGRWGNHLFYRGGETPRCRRVLTKEASASTNRSTR